MCGIAGIIGLADADRAKRLAAALAHRGPNDEGIEVFPAQAATEGSPASPAVSLAFRRLSILDLSPRGHQPMFNEDGSVCIVFNGEIYNYRELREELRNSGHTFKSDTDTEVIVHGYEQWGTHCAEKFRGMFAFAIWDSKRSRLLLARDRLGIKPLYWWRCNDRLVFASEIKGVLASGPVPRELDVTALNYCLAFGHLRPPMSMIEQVHVLAPAHTLLFETGSEPRLLRYWQLPPTAESTNEIGRMSPEQASHRTRELLDESIRLHMISDVPLGAFLSGGLDSTIIAGLMSRQVDKPIRTFCIGYGQEGSALNELQYARIAADHFGCDHTEAIISGSDVARDFEHFIWHLDRPSIDGLNSYLVSKVARQSVTVALSGLGGDELFIGYPHMLNIVEAAKLKHDYPWLAQVVRHMPLRVMTRVFSALAPLRFLDFSLGEQYKITRRLMDSEMRHQMLAEPSARSSGVFPAFEFQHPSAQILSDRDDLANRLSRIELQHYMAPILLRDMDAVSMAHALEVRPPFLDHKLVEFVCQLPAHLKVFKGPLKPLLAAAVRDLVPVSTVQRKKAFFHLPISAWMRNELRDFVEDATSEATVRRRGIFRIEGVRAIREQFRVKPRIWDKLWMLTVLEFWMRRYLDEPA